MTETEPQPTPAPAEQPAPASTPEDGQKPKSGGLPWGLLALMAVAVLVAVAVFSFPQWRDRVPGLAGGPAPAAGDMTLAQEVEVLRADLAATRDRLRQLELRLEQAPAAQPGAAPAPANLGPLTDRVAQLDQAVRQLQSQPRLGDEVEALSRQVAELRKTSADAGTVLRLADRVEQAEAQLREAQAKRSSAAALLLAVGQLREAVNGAMPFDAELRAVKALSAQDAEAAQALEALKPRAAGGIPTRLVLAGRFHDLAPVIVRSDAVTAPEGWWRQTLLRLSSLVTIRREDGSAAGDGTTALVARAEDHMGKGDLAAAVAELQRLVGPAAEAAAPWLADAQARLAADAALSELTAQVVAAVGPRQ